MRARNLVATIVGCVGMLVLGCSDDGTSPTTPLPSLRPILGADLAHSPVLWDAELSKAFSDAEQLYVIFVTASAQEPPAPCPGGTPIRECKSIPLSRSTTVPVEFTNFERYLSAKFTDLAITAPTAAGQRSVENARDRWLDYARLHALGIWPAPMDAEVTRLFAELPDEPSALSASERLNELVDQVRTDSIEARAALHTFIATR